MIEIDGITVRGCISFDRSKKDTSSSGKVTWHKRWEAEAGYYGVAFTGQSLRISSSTCINSTKTVY